MAQLAPLSSSTTSLPCCGAVRTMTISACIVSKEPAYPKHYNPNGRALSLQYADTVRTEPHRMSRALVDMSVMSGNFYIYRVR